MKGQLFAEGRVWVVVAAFVVVGCKHRVQEPTAVPFAFPRPPSPTPEPRGHARRVSAVRLLPPDAAAPANTLNGDPRGLKQEELRTALEAAMPSFVACLQNRAGPPTIGLTFDAQPDGSAQNIKLTGVSPADERCISTALTRLRLPRFEGNPVPVEFPLTFYRPPATAEAASPDAAVASVAPPVRTSVAVMSPATTPASPPAGTSTAPYALPTLPATAGSAAAGNQGKTFIQP